MLWRSQHSFRANTRKRPRLLALMISGGSRSLTGVCNGKCLWMIGAFAKGFARCFYCPRQRSTAVTRVCTACLYDVTSSPYTLPHLFFRCYWHILVSGRSSFAPSASVFEETLLTCCVLRGLQAWRGLQCFLILCDWTLKCVFDVGFPLCSR